VRAGAGQIACYTHCAHAAAWQCERPGLRRLCSELLAARTGQVPCLNSGNIDLVPTNGLCRFRGMVRAAVARYLAALAPVLCGL